MFRNAGSGKNDTSVLIGLSGKLNSVVQPVVPKGLAFCIVNAKGDILFHSESERSLQENILEESEHNSGLQTAINHRDSTLVDDVKLYDKDIKLLVSPIHGLPFYLVTYVDKRVQFLYLLHILSFTFLCESLILVVLSLLTVFIYYSNKRFSQLFFTHSELDFTKPSPLKKSYYQNIFYYHLTTLVVVGLIALVLPGSLWLYFVINMSVLLPFFSITGYYLIRYTDKNSTLLDTVKSNTSGRFRIWAGLFRDSHFTKNILRITVPYLLIIWLFYIGRNALHMNVFSGNKTVVNVLVILLQVLLPLLAFYTGVHGFPLRKKNVDTIPEEEKPTQQDNYLYYFIASILLSVILTTIIPVTGFLLNGIKQERVLQLKSQQVSLAKSLQNHRLQANKKTALAKFNTAGKDAATRLADAAYINSLKFSPAKGLYLDGNSLQTFTRWDSTEKGAFLNSTFYKLVSQYLFLPSDHPDFYTNNPDYY